MVLIQPHRSRRPDIAIASTRRRQPVVALINPVFKPLIEGANAAIDTVVAQRLFERMATSHHQFSVRLQNPTEMQRYFSGGIRPPRFPAGGRQLFQALWRSRTDGAQIEVTEFLTVISLRAISNER